jgi:predicted CopG family antitoxin
MGKSVGHRTITISDEAYEILHKMKKEGESFTEVIKRVASERSKRPLSSFAGGWAGDPKELDTLFRDLDTGWRRYGEELKE